MYISFASAATNRFRYWARSPVICFCRANDYGLAAAQEDFEAIFFNGGMEAADEEI